MVQKVDGFLTSDGRYFPTEEEAEFNEAKMLLEEALAASGVRDAKTAFGLIWTCREPIMRFLNATQAAEMNGETTDEPEEVDYGLDDDNLGERDLDEPEEDTEAVQPLPPGVRKPVSDVGRHIQPTKILVERKINGPRGRQPDARDIRGGESVATTPRRRPPKTR